jgi:2-aminoadipate transaminase
LVDFLAEKGITVRADEIIIASGSQGVLDGLAKVLISRGDRVAVEAPTYLGALQAFNAYEPSYVSLETDADGLIPDSLEETLITHRPKMVYLAPTFQNPSGRTIPLERRRRIADILRENNALLVEDDPYGALRYRGVEVPPIKSLAPDHVIYISTLSKVFAPGLRIGFCAAPDPIRHWMILAKQGVDLHTSTFNQALAAEYLAGGYLKAHLPKIIRLYRPKQEAMLRALEKHFPGHFQWSRPEGGMFVWVEGPAGLDMDLVFSRSLERNVAFVPGRYFYTDPEKGLETMRLNYTMADGETIDRAVKTIGEVIRQVA